MGSRLKSDDSAGSILAEKLKNIGLDAFDGGTLPETFTGTIKKLSPKVLVLIDACAMGLNAGEFRLIPLDKISADESFNSHSMSLVKLIAYLKNFVPEVTLIGIEPKSIEFGEDLSEEVSASVEKLFRIIRDGDSDTIECL